MVLAKVLSPLSLSVGEDVKTGPPALLPVVSLGTISGERFGEPREDGGTPVAPCSVSPTVHSDTCIDVPGSRSVFIPLGNGK